MTEQLINKFTPNVKQILSNKLQRNLAGMLGFIDKTKNFKVSTKFFDFSTTDTILKIPTNSVDIVVTSPPYGDSRTTVAYGQFSRLSNEWLGFTEAREIDKRLMGGTTKGIKATNIYSLDKTINKLLKVDLKRAREVYSFYDDYLKSINNVAKLIKKGGHACYVVGNRCVKDLVLPTDEITKAIFESCGFTHINTFMRNIPNKRMPSKNSPSNQAGNTGTTMKNEYIVVMRK